jgi:hypothetical protein
MSVTEISPNESGSFNAHCKASSNNSFSNNQETRSSIEHGRAYKHSSFNIDSVIKIKTGTFALKHVFS